MTITLPRNVTAKRSEACYSRREKRWAGGGKRARNTSKAFNRAERNAVKRILRSLTTP